MEMAAVYRDSLISRRRMDSYQATLQLIQNQSIDVDFNLIDKCKYQPMKKRSILNNLRKVISKHFSVGLIHAYSRKLRYRSRLFGA